MSMVRWAVVWVGLCGFYLFLAGQVSTVEMAASVACAFLGTALTVGLARVAHHRFRFRPTPRAILLPLAKLVVETFTVGWEFAETIVRPVDKRGGFVRQPFDPGADGDPVAAGRRAVAVLGVSLAPGSFVVRGDRSDTLVLHALPEKAASSDRRWPS